VPNIRADKEVPFKTLTKLTSDQYIRADKEVLFKNLIKITSKGLEGNLFIGPNIGHL
jgi:biopolymer transport protein ExbD